MAHNSWFSGTHLAMGLPMGFVIGMMLGNWVFGIPIGIMFALAFSSSGSPTPASDDDGQPRERGDG